MSADPPVRTLPSPLPVTGLRWPLPALLAWLACWLVLAGLRQIDTPASLCWSAATSLGAGAALLLRGASGWRRLIVAGGFPASALASGLAGSMPGWAWLLPLGLVLAAYPLRAWRDAPLFPTPAGALDGLATLAPLPAGARVLDAGCGLGHGLLALRAAYPQARLEGVEWSRVLQLAAAWRCRWARVHQGDLWAGDWSRLALVYLFQRPESMARAWAKAQAEMAPGSWLASLDFAVRGVQPAAVLRRPGAQPVWLYRVGPRRAIADGQGGTPAAGGSTCPMAGR